VSVRRREGEDWIDIEYDRDPFGVFNFDREYSSINLVLKIGFDEAQEDVREAFFRLCRFWGADNRAPAGVSRYSLSLGSELQESFTRPVEYNSRAITISGAADLLRPYKRIVK